MSGDITGAAFFIMIGLIALGVGISRAGYYIALALKDRR